MERYNERLCITHAELTDGIMSRSLLKQLRHRGKVMQTRVGGNGREALFAVDSLPLKYQTEIYRRYPDAKGKAASTECMDYIEYDGIAFNFFDTYKLEDGRNLPPERIAEYTNNATILNGFRKRLERANSHRKRQNGARLSRTEFWQSMASALPHLADKYPHSLPENPRRLQQKYNLYIAEGYKSLISKKFLKRNAAKVADEVQESILTSLLADARNLEDTTIAKLYNMVAANAGWPEISPSAVGVWRKKLYLTTAAGRLGETEFNNRIAMQVKRRKPSAPLLYWTLDGWDVELYYQQRETKIIKGKEVNVTTYWNRLTMVVVLDPCCNYPIGYAIGTHENSELIKAALRNAADHTAELFGQRYRSNQLQSDHYALKAMTPVYEAMSDKVTPARVKNAKSKVVERYFHHINSQYFKLFRNWSGHNITSDPTKQPNSDALNHFKKQFPDLQGCIEQIQQVMEAERKAKRADYIKAWAHTPDDRKLPLSTEQYLLHFGAETGYKNSIEGQGLCPTIEGQDVAFDCFDMEFRRHADKLWIVKYDPNDLNQALAVSEDGSLRFMLEAKYIQPMALADRKDGDAEQLERVQDHNKQLRSTIINQLGQANETTVRYLQGNPKLDNTLTKAVLCDSMGQHKDNRNARRLAAQKQVPPASQQKAIGYDPIDIYDEF